MTVTDEMKKYKRDRAPTIKKMIEKIMYIDYGTYSKFRKIIITGDSVE